MSRERGLHRDVGGLRVADLADHDDIWILAQDRTQPGGKRQSNLGFYLHLVDTDHLVFNRVLDSHDVHVTGVQLRQHRVQRGCLPGARGACHQDYPVRRVDGVLEFHQIVGGKPQAIQIEAEGALVEHAHHDLFAVDGRRYGDA